jgi:hypothetical protein
MTKNKFEVGDLVDVHPAVKKFNTGLAIIVDREYDYDGSYYTLLWSDGQVSLAHRANIIPVV